jgi:hypothetical protein
MMTAPTIVDTNGHTVVPGDDVFVTVGPKRTRCCGRVLSMTAKNVLVRFTWGNGRQTDRRFKVIDLGPLVVIDVEFDGATYGAGR